MVSQQLVARTQTKLAAILGVSRSTVVEWTAKGCPRNADGSYHVAAVEAWAAARSDTEGAVADGSLAQWKLRRERAAALRAESELAREQRDLIPRAAVERMQLGIVESFVSALENLPAKVVPLLLGARTHTEMEDVLRNHVRMLRIQLAAKHSPKPTEVTT